MRARDEIANGLVTCSRKKDEHPLMAANRDVRCWRSLPRQEEMI
jgi:hypothetical protein